MSSALPTHIGTRIAARLLGVSEDSVANYADDGVIPNCIRTLGGHRRIPVAWVLDQLPPGEYDLTGQSRGFKAVSLQKQRSIASKGDMTKRKAAVVV